MLTILVVLRAMTGVAIVWLSLVSVGHGGKGKLQIGSQLVPGGSVTGLFDHQPKLERHVQVDGHFDRVGGLVCFH